MPGSTKRIGQTALALLLAVAVIGTVGPGASAQEAPATTVAPATTEVPPTTEAPTTTTEAPAPPTTAAPTTTVVPAPSDEVATPATTNQRRVDGGPSTRRGPDPRWVDFGRCGRGYTACDVAKRYQNRGQFLWRHGRVFWWGGDRVRGHPEATWANFRLEARRVRLYLFALAVQRHRRELVGRWSGVAHCESGGNWSINTGNGYYGGLQFSLGTWRAYGGSGYPHQQSKAEQVRVAERVRTSSGLHHWPVCGRRF